MNYLMINDDCNYKVAKKKKERATRLKDHNEIYSVWWMRSASHSHLWSSFRGAVESRAPQEHVNFLPRLPAHLLHIQMPLDLRTATGCQEVLKEGGARDQHTTARIHSLHNGLRERASGGIFFFFFFFAIRRRSWTLKAVADTICRGSTDGRLFRQRTQCHLGFLHQWLTSTLAVWRDGWDGRQLEFLHTTAATMINARHQAIVCKTRGCEAPRRADTVLTLSCL